MKPAFISVDWGSSNIRTRLVGADGSIVETRSSNNGVFGIVGGDFKKALEPLVGDWVATWACPMVASGMIGSRNGWLDTGYLWCPVALNTVADHVHTIRDFFVIDGTYVDFAFHIIPGIQCIDAWDNLDVMRGEETEVFSLCGLHKQLCVVPGTHSKWVQVNAQGEITSFWTAMTGELYSLLTAKSSLSALMSFGASSSSAFARGVVLGFQSSCELLHSLFSVRTLVLRDSLAKHEAPDYLSGMLIGQEIRSARQYFQWTDAVEIPVIGSGALGARYVEALDILGVGRGLLVEHAATAGQRLIARAAGIIQ